MEVSREKNYDSKITLKNNNNIADDMTVKLADENYNTNNKRTQRKNFTPKLTKEYNSDSDTESPNLTLNDFVGLADPKKIKTDTALNSEYDTQYSSNDSDENENNSMPNIFGSSNKSNMNNKNTMRNLNNDSESDNDDIKSEDSYYSEGESESESEKESAAEKYERLQREKQDLLFKLDRLYKSLNIKPTRVFNINSQIEDIKYEYLKIKKQRDVDKSIRFQRRALMTVVSGIEYLNDKFDPIDAQLEGWSDSVMENVGDYDEIFEELHDKYAEKISMAPELKLMLAVGGSAVMFHLTKTLFKSSLPGVDDILKSNPELMQNIMQAAANNMQNNQNGAQMNFNSQQQSQKSYAPPPPQPQQPFAPERSAEQNSGFMGSMMNMFMGKNQSENNQSNSQSQQFRSQSQSAPSQQFQQSQQSQQSRTFSGGNQPSGRKMQGPRGVDDILSGMNSGISEDDSATFSKPNRKKPAKNTKAINIDI